jgi:hypothetical protein
MKRVLGGGPERRVFEEAIAENILRMSMMLASDGNGAPELTLAKPGIDCPMHGPGGKVCREIAGAHGANDM